MTEIKRYAPVWAPPDEMTEDPQGQWVRWEDVRQLIYGLVFISEMEDPGMGLSIEAQMAKEILEKGLGSGWERLNTLPQTEG